MTTLETPVNIVISGVGGQGVLLAAASIAGAALEAGHNVYMGEVHGMAQRGGTVIATVRMGPVTSGMIGVGEATVVLGLEAAETYRMREYINPTTWAIMNERRIPPVSVNLGHEEYPPNSRIVEGLHGLTSNVMTVPALSLAVEAGSRRVENVVMLGALAMTGSLPFGADVLEGAMERLIPPKWLEVNQQAFRLGQEHVAQ